MKNCPFCQCPMTSISMDSPGFYICDRCPHGVQMVPDGDYFFTYRPLNSFDYYQIIFRLSEPSFTVYKNNIFRSRRLVLWNFIPDVTPYNIENKLPFILTFL
jgi:hypothetical protein